MSYPIVRLDKMTGTSVPTCLFSARYQVSGTDTAIPNGSFVTLDGLMDGERELYKAAAPTAATSLSDLYLVATPEVCYRKEDRRLSDFTNVAGSNIRVYALPHGDIFSISKDGLDGTPEVGGVIVAQAGVKGKAVASGSAGSNTVIGTIIAIENDFVVIQVG